MFIDIDLITMQWLIFIGASVCAFMIGYLINNVSQDKIMEATILYLVDKKMVKWKKDENGEIELMPIDD